MAASAQILCVKCGAAATAPGPDCVKCGGRNARVCGACGNQNSVAKNYCDKCGRSIVSLGPISPPPPPRPVDSPPPIDLPKTAVVRRPATVPGVAAPAAATNVAPPLTSDVGARVSRAWPRRRWLMAASLLVIAAAAAYTLWTLTYGGGGP